MLALMFLDHFMLYMVDQKLSLWLLVHLFEY